MTGAEPAVRPASGNAPVAQREQLGGSSSGRDRQVTLG
jgi:hypothetical protein